MKKFIPVNQPLLKGNEKKYLINAINTNWISSEGPYIKKFENLLEKKFLRKNAIAVTNGTAALDIAIESLGIKAGDEIIAPSFTIISCLLQIVRIGAKPILIDSDPINWNMKVEDIEKKITKKTKAILIVHTYGLPVDLDPILKLVKKYNLYLIEDAAEVIGQNYKGRPCGSFGDVSTFSFYVNKQITTGEGGAILTNNLKIAETCRSLRNLCFQKNKRFVHKKLGWNCRMTNLQAAVGLAQLEKLDYFIKLKRKIGNIYSKNFESLKHIVRLPLKSTMYADNIYWVYGMVLNKDIKLTADTFINFLKSKNIDSRPFFSPMHTQPIFKKMKLFKKVNCPVSEDLYKYGFYIPSGLGITMSQINYVSETILGFFKKFTKN
jgi:perosamine synthetase